MPHFKARVSSGMLALSLTLLLQRELTSECNHTHRHTQFWGDVLDVGITGRVLDMWMAF